MRPDAPRAEAGGSTLCRVGIALFLFAAAVRVANALLYPALHGFDAQGNWQYILKLSRSWALPEPASGWSTGHPPLFYYLSALLVRAARAFDLGGAIVWVRLLVSAAGLGVAWLAAELVRRTDPENRRRRLLAAALVLFLPAHVMLSAMVHEELVAALFTSLAVVALSGGLARRAAGGEAGSLAHALGVGAASGLALLTKLSGAAAAAAAAAAYAADGALRRAPRAALLRAAVAAGAAALLGGWYYAHSFVRHGYLYPHALPAHQIMFTMPPGDRELLDYVRVPPETFTDPQLLSPALLRSVWGSTFATIWFDGHRFFLPRRNAAVSRLGTAILLLALVPTAAFAVGLARGVRRALRGPGTPDLPLLLLVALTLAGYALFTWRNPWFATLKGSYLLGLCVPFAFYASEVLDDWTRGAGVRAAMVRALLALLAAAVTLAFTYGLVFEKVEPPGLPWLGARP